MGLQRVLVRAPLLRHRRLLGHRERPSPAGERDSRPPAYSGRVRFANLGPLSLKTAILGFNVTAQCDNAVLNGSLVSDGSSGSLDSVTVNQCSSSVGGTASITFQNLPYTEATASYAPVSGGICPSTGTANGHGTVIGETAAGSGVFDQTLYATGS
ncbi:hypothetical protein [Actinomadura verrucosospora]|uniref:Uncharacterized protein n=1 Tax=Actinomadura verrucosospora TaxID=46165 RepID=A0A7D3ZHR7_ACTVE|nr:hypothetical protein [Actinomadura verrucosospora]QKG24077.1 hypothetical protein ACTIVE_5720 [Actinomadura verrucosospora]